MTDPAIASLHWQVWPKSYGRVIECSALIDGVLYTDKHIIGDDELDAVVFPGSLVTASCASIQYRMLAAIRRGGHFA